jgi:hypothetical protein
MMLYVMSYDGVELAPRITLFDPAGGTYYTSLIFKGAESISDDHKFSNHLAYFAIDANNDMLFMTSVGLDSSNPIIRFG